MTFRFAFKIYGLTLTRAGSIERIHSLFFSSESELSGTRTELFKRTPHGLTPSLFARTKLLNRFGVSIFRHF